MAIRFFDMFAGIGGFRSGLEAIGGFECVGHCEIDKFANQAYNAIYEPKGEVYYEDARQIEPRGIPDLIVCYRGRFIGLECKVGKNEATVLQSLTIRRILRAGGYAMVVRSVEEVKQLILAFEQE